jgi:hypothetical protein
VLALPITALRGTILCGMATTTGQILQVDAQHIRGDHEPHTVVGIFEREVSDAALFDVRADNVASPRRHRERDGNHERGLAGADLRPQRIERSRSDEGFAPILLAFGELQNSEPG